MTKNAEKITVQLKLLLKNMSNEEIQRLRKKFTEITKK